MSRDHRLGIVFGLLTAFCWAISPIFIRLGLLGLPSSLWGVTIGLLASTLVYGLWFAGPERQRLFSRGRDALRADQGRIARLAIPIQILAGVSAGIGVLSRTISIDLAPIVVVVPLGHSSALFTLILAPLVLGAHLERITPRLTAGVLLVVAGAALIVIGQNL